MTSARRIGVLGGTFNPVHLGHLIIAENAMDQLCLDTVLFVPAGVPPHKEDDDLLPGEFRLAMVDAAISGRLGFSSSTIDMAGDGPSFTWQLLERLRDADPEAELEFLMGADSLVSFETWSRPERILELARLGIAYRPGHPIAASDWTDVPGLSNSVDPIESPAIDISSTDIRKRVRTGRSIRFLVPESVRGLIEMYSHYAEVQSPAQ